MNKTVYKQRFDAFADFGFNYIRLHSKCSCSLCVFLRSLKRCGCTHRPLGGARLFPGGGRARVLSLARFAFELQHAGLHELNDANVEDYGINPQKQP